MAERREIYVLTLGGKGSSLSCSSLYAAASGRAQLRIDCSALDRLSSLRRRCLPLASCKHQIVFDDFLTLEDRRAILVVLLNRLLLSNARGIRALLPELIAEALNSKSQSLKFEEVDVTEDEMYVLESSRSSLLGVSAIVHHQSRLLSALADFAASLSCEASKSNVTAFYSPDPVIRHGWKESVGVCSLLDGCKVVGKDDTGSVWEIPFVHGHMREVAKWVDTQMGEELKTGVGTEEVVSGSSVLSVLQGSLRMLGECSSARVKTNLASMARNEARSRLEGIFAEKCPADSSLHSVVRGATDSCLSNDFGKSASEVKMLLETVWNIVAWEVVTAFAALEPVGANGDDTKPEKKKKVLLGKGNSGILQLIKERLQKKIGDAVDVGMSGLLEIWVGDFLSLFDLKDPEFDVFLSEIKDFNKRAEEGRNKAFSLIKEVSVIHCATALDEVADQRDEIFSLRYHASVSFARYVANKVANDTSFEACQKDRGAFDMAGEDFETVKVLAEELDALNIGDYEGAKLFSVRYHSSVSFARYVVDSGLTYVKAYQKDRGAFDIAGGIEMTCQMGPDFETLSVLTHVLDELNVGDYEVKLNHRKLLDGMMQICGVPGEKFGTVSSSIAKLDRQSFDQIRREMVEEKGISAETADKIETFVMEKGPPLALLSKFQQEWGSAFSEQAGCADALKDLEILFKGLDKSKRTRKVVLDLSLARGLDYYTGVMYEAVLKGGAQVVPIAAGGRYDNLIGKLGGNEVEAVGCSLDMEMACAIKMEQLQKDRNQVV